MTEPYAGAAAVPEEESQVSLLAIGSLLLRWRRTIFGLGLVGMAIGITSGLLSLRLFTSSAVFVPQGTESAASGLSVAASQLGIRIPTSSGSGWGPAMYVELLHSRALLEPLVSDTVVVAEENGRRVAVTDLLEIVGPPGERKMDLAVRAVGGLVGASEKPKLNAVEVTVTSRWPSVSRQLAERLLLRINEFNIETRKSQAMTELKFVEAQSIEAQRALRDAEDRLQSFLQSNRTIGSPELSFERDRLQRAVTERQQLYTSWLQTREEARIRELRDTPVITVLERPRLPIRGVSRKTVRKGMMGLLVGSLLGLGIAFVAHAFAAARAAPSPEAREFFRLLQLSTPRFVRRVFRW